MAKIRSLMLFLLFLVLCVHVIDAKDLTIGTRVNNLLVSTEKVVFGSIPFVRRDKDYKYTDSKQRIIKGIIARDLSRTEAEVTVMEGGVGASHVTLHLRSDRGVGLNYLILIFTNNA